MRTQLLSTISAVALLASFGVAEAADNTVFVEQLTAGNVADASQGGTQNNAEYIEWRK